MIAARAKVTPSTLYRRWGDLTNLLADVSAQRLQPDQMPADSGDWQADLRAWTEQYADEMSSPLGRHMLRDVISATVESGIANNCRQYVTQQIAIICERGKDAPDAELVLEQVISPILYRILFDDRPADREFCAKLLERVL
jgi:AcrR family transcriptional regulator